MKPLNRLGAAPWPTATGSHRRRHQVRPGRLLVRARISLTGRIAVVDLSPQMRDDFSALYQRWQEDRDLSTDS
jgi:hypothetical protein